MPALPAAEIERVFREEYGRAVAVLVRVFGDIDIAEEAVQDAFTAAVAAVAVRRAAAEPGGMDHHHRPQPGDRPPPPRGVPRRPARPGGAAARPRRTGRGGRRARRPAPPDLHLLPPGARAERAGRADAAAARRARPPRRSRAPSSCPSRRWRSGWSAPRARSATPASRTACRARPTCPTACAPVLAVVYLDLQRGLHGELGRAARARRPLRGGHPPRPPAGRAHARRAGGHGAARADAAHRVAPGRPHDRGRRPRAAGRPGPRAAGTAT